MLTMVLTWLLVWVAAIRATPTPGAEHAPGATPEHVPTAKVTNTMVGAETISPLFPFSFYGHVVDGFYITTHGFLSLFPRLHDYIYKIQYIAPLRIKLDPSGSNSSPISVLGLPDRLTVE